MVNEQKSQGPTVKHEDSIKDTEGSWVNGDIENGAIFDPNGNLLLIKKGKKDSITFKNDEVKLMKGNIVTHNHPSDGPLSPADIYGLITTGAIEHRAAVRNGVYYIRPPEVWDERIDTIDKLSFEWDNILKEVIPGVQELAKKGLIKTKKEYLIKCADLTNKKFAERFGFDYGFEEK